MDKGIDIPIGKLVSLFESDLWTGFNNSFYGRVFRNERFDSFPSKVSPEYYEDGASEPIEVLKNDSFDSQCFFDVQPNESIDGNVHTAKVWICFMVNAIKLYPLLTMPQATEECHREVENIIGESQFHIEGVVRGFEGFVSYDWGRNIQASADFYPYYIFRFDTELIYGNKNC